METVDPGDTSAPATAAAKLNHPGATALRSAVPLSMSQSWSGGPMANLPVISTTGTQQFSSAISDGAGGMILVWQDARSAVSGYDIYAQHVAKCGMVDPTWPANGVALTTAPGDQFHPVLTSDGAGGAFVAWREGFAPSNGVTTQHVLGTGLIAPGWPANGFVLCTTPNTRQPKIAPDGAGGAFVTWDDNRAGQRVFVQHLLSGGLDPGWTPGGVRICPLERFQTISAICTDGAGGALVAWGDNRNFPISGRDLYAQRINAAGALQWVSAGVPVCTAPRNQLFLGANSNAIWVVPQSDAQSGAMVSDGAGGCFLIWLDDRNGPTTDNDIYAQHLDAAGNVAAGWPVNGVALCTAPGSQNGPTIMADRAGGAIATWREDSRPNVFAQHVSSSGTVDGPLNGLGISAAAGANTFPYAVSDGATGAIIAWGDPRNSATSGDDAFAQHLQTSPFMVDPLWTTNGVPISTASGDQDPYGALVTDGAGGAITSWDDTRNFATNGSDIYAQRVTASGVLPSDPVATITGPPSGSVYAVNTVVSFTGSFTDPDGGTHTAQWTFDALPPVAGTVSEGGHTVSANYGFTTPGVYMVKLTVTDECGGSSTATQVGGFDAMVVIYDPNAGFVTGGGWINSPPGAYTADPSLVGKANFGFVSKYEKGATVPTGNTEFQFKVANLNFHSTSYDWLVIAGAKAQYKGSGAINGAGDYKFILTATDGDLQGGVPDKFRMKITTAGGGLVYDNQMGGPDGADPTTVLEGGSIVIHKTAGGGGASLAKLAPLDYALNESQPNPFKFDTDIRYSLPERSRLTIALFDVSGRKMRDLVHEDREAGSYSVGLSSQDRTGNRLGEGVYYLRMTAKSLEGGSRFAATRTLVVLR